MNEIVKWTSLMVKISCLHVQSLSLDYGRKCAILSTKQNPLAGAGNVTYVGDGAGIWKLQTL